MIWFRCIGGSSGGDEHIVFKTYIKFNGYGIILPWEINSDYKIEVIFNETTYNNDSSIIGNTYGPSLLHLTEYSNKYYCSIGNSEGNFGSWTSGEHTFIVNDNGYNKFDGSNVTSYNPTTSAYKYTLGCRGYANTNTYYGYIKSYKIYSITNDELIHDLKPSLVYNQPCFIDVISGKVFTNDSIQAVDSI